MKQQKLKEKMAVTQLETERKSRMKYIAINHNFKANSTRSDSQMSVGALGDARNSIYIKSETALGST